MINKKQGYSKNTIKLTKKEGELQPVDPYTNLYKGYQYTNMYKGYQLIQHTNLYKGYQHTKLCQFNSIINNELKLNIAE